MEDLKTLRKKIDKIDAAIIKKLARRQKISKKIGFLKVSSKKKIKDSVREKKQKSQYKKLCTEFHIDFKFINQLFDLIICHSRALQKTEETKHRRPAA